MTAAARRPRGRSVAAAVVLVFALLNPEWGGGTWDSGGPLNSCDDTAERRGR